MALESRDGRAICGLVRNPLGYLFRAAHPGSDVPVLADPIACDASHQLSVELATTLGLGLGCDASDDEESIAWGCNPGLG